MLKIDLSKSFMSNPNQDSKNNIKTATSIQDLVKQSFEKKLSGDLSTKCIPTGFSKLDKMSGGFYPGDLIVFGGRPGMGTTQFMVNLALNMSKVNPVLFFTYDLTPYSLNQRIVSCISKIPLYKLFEHDSEIALKKFQEVKDELDNHELYIIDTGHENLNQFEEICRNHIVLNDIKVIFVDDLQLMASAKSANKRSKEIYIISRTLKNLARELNILLVVSSQVSRNVEKRGGDRRPYLYDLLDAECLESLADKVIFICRPEYYGLLLDENGDSNQNLMELDIFKNNNGSTKGLKMYKDEYFTYFSEEKIVSKCFDKAFELIKSLEKK
jgi:replicative DNA helicase